MIAAHMAFGPLTRDAGRVARSVQAVAASEIWTEAPTKTAVCWRGLNSRHRNAFTFTSTVAVP